MFCKGPKLLFNIFEWHSFCDVKLYNMLAYSSYLKLAISCRKMLPFAPIVRLVIFLMISYSVWNDIYCFPNLGEASKFCWDLYLFLIILIFQSHIKCWVKVFEPPCFSSQPQKYLAKRQAVLKFIPDEKSWKFCVEPAATGTVS